MKKFRKILSVLFAIIMLLVSIDTTAFAVEKDDIETTSMESGSIMSACTAETICAQAVSDNNAEVVSENTSVLQEEENNDGDEEENEKAECARIIKFASLSHGTTHIYLTEKLSLSELVLQMPQTLDVILEKGETTQINVTWECTVNYDTEMLTEYTFDPIWDKDKFSVREGALEIFDIPSIYVFIEGDALCNEISTFSIDANGTMDFDIYLANYYLNYQKYYLYDYSNPYRTYVENLWGDKLFQNSLYGWRVTTFDLASEAGYAQKEYAYCQAVLFDILYEGNGFPDILSGVNYSAKLLNASGWKKLLKLDKTLYKDMKVTQENIESLEEYISGVDELSDAVKKIGNLKDYVDYFNNVYDVVEKVAKVQAILNLPREMANIFSEMEAGCSSYLPLKYALQEFSAFCAGSMTTEQIALLFSSEVAITEISKMLLKSVWKSVMESCSEVGLMIETGQAMGKYGSNLLFSTDKIIENYYTLENLYYFENVLKSKVYSYASTFQSNPTINNARKFNTAVKLLYSTYKIGIDYAIKFVKATYDEGLVAKIYRLLDSSDYDKIVDSLNFLQKCLRSFGESEEFAKGLYADEYGSDLELDNNVIVVDITPEQQNTLLTNIKVESVKLSNINITEDTTLTEDVSTYGNLYVKSGVTLNLNGHTMDIGGDAEIAGDVSLSGGILLLNGNLIHQQGTISFDKGKIRVSGDYIGAKCYDEKISGSNSSVSIRLLMNDEKDVFNVRGNFLCYTYAQDVPLSAGRLAIGGNVEIFDGDYSSPFSCDVSHQTVLNGSSLQTIKIYGCASLGTLQQVNSDISIESLNFKALGSSLYMQSNGTAKIGTYESNLNFGGNNAIINGDVDIKGNIDLQGGTLTVSGDLTYSGKSIWEGGTSKPIGDTLKVNGGLLKVTGNVESKNDIDVGNGKIEVTGNFKHTNDELFLNKGEVFVIGDMILSDCGSIKMVDDEDELIVCGNFSAYNSTGSIYITGEEHGTLTRGTATFKGDVIDNGPYSNLVFGEDTKVILDGTVAQKIKLSNKDRFGQTYVQNEKCQMVEFRACQLMTDAVLYSESGTLEIEDFNGKDVLINGDASIYNSNLNHGSLHVKGNLSMHDASKYVLKYIWINGGTLTVDENLNYGLLKMIDDKDTVTIKGDLIFSDGDGSRSEISAGTINLFGNFVDSGKKGSNFICSGTNKFVFYGEGKKISSNTLIAFNNIEFKHDITIEGKVILQKFLNDVHIFSNDATIGYGHAYDASHALYSVDYMDTNGHNIIIDGNVKIMSPLTIRGELTVNGNLLFGYGSTIDFSNGLLTVSGDLDMSEAYGKHGMIAMGENDCVVLNGESHQTITLMDSNKFSNLRVLKTIDNYTFHPNPCWDTLITGDCTIDVTGVALESDTMSMQVGEEKTLVATVIPAMATNKKVTWLSSDPSIAIVNNKGHIETLAVGTVIVSATTDDGEFVAKCTVKVLDNESPVEREYTMTFDSCGGSSVAIQKVKENEYAYSPENPVRVGYIFDGWYLDKTYKTNWDFENDVVTGNITLYAKWIKAGDIEGEDPKPGGILPEDIPETGIPEGIWIAGIMSKTYTGNNTNQSFRVYDGSKRLQEKIDYTVTYKNSKNAYTYTDDDYADFEEKLRTTGKKVRCGTFDPVKAPQVIIKMRGNYSGNQTIYYSILPVDFKEDIFTVYDVTVTYSGKKQTPVPVLTWNGKALKCGNDFYIPEYDYAKNDKNTFTVSGTYDLTITGKGNFTGEIPIVMTISESAKQIAMDKVTVKGIKNLAWTGSQLMQNDFKVSYKKDVLSEEDGDYIISWGTNTDVGMGTVTFTGTGIDADGDGYSYVGTKTVFFKIIGVSMSKVIVSGVEKSYPYTGMEIEPEVELSYKAGKNVEPVSLTKNIHYTASYEKNRDKGTATIILTGLESGGYTGTKKITFKIKASQIRDIVEDGSPVERIQVAFKDTENIKDHIYIAPYMKGGVRPEVIVTCEGKTLKADLDYTVTYMNNKQVALSTDSKAPAVVIKGKGNYTGSKKVPFTITTKPLTNENGITIVANDKAESTKPNGYRQNFTVYDADGKKLGKDEYDFKSVIYTLIQTTGKDGAVSTMNEVLDKASVVPAGSVIQITVQGKGDYAGGFSTGTYRILKKGYDISRATIQIQDQTYTGNPVYINEQSQFKTGKVYIKIGKETRELVLGEDIEVLPGSYVKNVDKGTAKVTFRGINDFGGTKTVNYKIGARSIEQAWKGIREQLFH